MKLKSHLRVVGLTTLVGGALTLPVSFAIATPAIEHITVNGSRLAIPADRLAASRTVLTERDISASGAVQLTDLLRGLPGVSIAQSGSPGALTEIRLRGSESNHLLVLIDGVIANDIGQGSLLDLAHLTTANIVHIELLRGPQSALWGSGAIGGVLSITTRSASGEGTTDGLTAHAGIGARNTYRAGLNAGGQASGVTVRGYAEVFNTSGDNVSRQGNEADGYQNITLGTSLSYRLSNAHLLDWTLRATSYENEYDSIDSINTGLPADTINVTEGSQLTSRLRWQFSPHNSQYSSTVSWQYHSDDNDNRVERVDAGGTTGERQQLTWLNRFELSSDWSFAGGLDYLRRAFEQRGPVNFGDPNQAQHDTTTAAFAELAGEIAPHWHSSVSLRYDNNSEFDDAVSYRTGITWQPTPSLALFASHGRAVKTPTFTERFGYFPGSFIGNPDLEVERSQEWEIGLRTDIGLTGLNLSVFDSELENEILGYVFVPDLGGATARNATADSHRRGLEASFDVTTDMVTLGASYTYLEADEDADGSALTELRRARHQGALTLRSELGTDRLSIYARLAYTGSREDIFYPPYPQPAARVQLRPYTLASVNLSYQVSAHWQFALRIDNAFDTSYEDIVGYTGERRRAMLTLSFTE